MAPLLPLELVLQESTKIGEILDRRTMTEAEVDMVVGMSADRTIITEEELRHTVVTAEVDLVTVDPRLRIKSSPHQVASMLETCFSMSLVLIFRKSLSLLELSRASSLNLMLGV